MEILTTTPEPKGKLGAMTTRVQTTTPDAVVVVNGPDDDLLDWDAIDWPTVRDDVRRLRQRIFTASKVGDLKWVRSLQKLMLRSRASTLLSVRRVTEVNGGRKTAGIDGEVVLGSAAKAALVGWLQHNTEPWQARPVKRVYIPKRGSTGKRRPLGVPVVVDRCLQARVVNALEPEWEARFEPRSYGLRRAASGSGFLTPIWRRRSTGSIISICSVSSARSLPGDSSPAGSKQV